MAGKLYRDPNQGKLAGVCAGFADYLGIDVVIVRVIWLIMVFAASFGLLLYIACWIVMPEKRDVVKVMREEEVSAEMQRAKDAGYYETE